jgi:hypothetical protein
LPIRIGVAKRFRAPKAVGAVRGGRKRRCAHRAGLTPCPDERLPC